MRCPGFHAVALSLVLGATAVGDAPRGQVDASELDARSPQTFDRMLGAWQGEVGGKLPVVMRFVATPSGQLSGFFDSPSEGSKGRVISALRIDGDAVQLEIASIQCSFKGRISTDGSVITGEFTLMNGTRHALSLEPVDTAALPYLTPRFDAEGRPELEYTYTPPPAVDDGWTAGRISSECEQSLAPMMMEILDESYPGIESVLIVKDGTLVVEEYFYGFDRMERHQIRSMTKTVGSILTGIAIQQGLLAGVDETVVSFFPELAVEQQWDERKRRMTVEHLLTMTSGFKGDDWADNHTSSKPIWSSPNWIESALSGPMVAEPGKRFAYYSASLMALSGILEKVSGVHASEFAARYLFSPLGIEDVKWKRSPQGAVSLGGGLRMRPRDLAKIGQLYLNKGRWGDEQIVSEAWVSESIRARNRFWGPRRGYGYLWYSKSFGKKHSIDGYYASGLGGQKVLYVPELSLVVVITTGNYYESKAIQKQSFEILARIIETASALAERFTGNAEETFPAD